TARVDAARHSACALSPACGGEPERGKPQARPVVWLPPPPPPPQAGGGGATLETNPPPPPPPPRPPRRPGWGRRRRARRRRGRRVGGGAAAAADAGGGGEAALGPRGAGLDDVTAALELAARRLRHAALDHEHAGARGARPERDREMLRVPRRRVDRFLQVEVR